MAVALPATGCSAIFSTVKVAQADRALREARDKGAADLAPYEYTLAERYYDKALEESFDAQHRTAIALSKVSTAYAAAAVKRTEGGGPDVEGIQNDVPTPQLLEQVDNLGEAPSTPDEDRPRGLPEDEAPKDDLGDFLEEDADDDDIDIPQAPSGGGKP